MAQRPDAGSEPASSPPAFLGQTCSSKPIPRRLFSIPSEQQKLLDDGSSWAGALYSRPQRNPNVPACVLNDIEEYHTRSRKHSKQPPQSSVSAPSQPKSSRSTGDNSNVEGKGRDDESGNDESEDEVIGGWSLSPERDLQFKRHPELAPEQPPVSQASVADRRSPRKASTPQRHDSPEQPFASQLPEDDGCPPPRAPSSRAVTPRRDASSGPTFVTQQSASKVPASPSEASVLRRTCASPEQPFASQLPTRFPPRSTSGILNRPQKRTTCFNSFPPSSSGPEEDLEVVPPAPYTGVALPARGPPALNPTPPSAQVQVPCTAGFEPASPMTAPPPKKPKPGNRSRYKRADVSGFLNDPIPTALPPTVTGLRRPPTNTKSKCHDLDSSTSDDFVSSSIIPSTHPGKPRSTPAKSSLSRPIVEETQRPALQSSITSDASPRRGMAQLRPLSPTPARPLPFRTEVLSPQCQHGPTWSSPVPETAQHRGTQRPYPVLPATLPDTSPLGNPAVQSSENGQSLPPMPQVEILGSPGDMAQHSAPFIQYALNYPSYTGSIGDFLNACSYVQILQRRRALASYSYDDFIRAWYQGYLPYIETFSGSTKTPMSAIEWYMESVPRMEFTSGIITKENLEYALEFYQPKEVSMARQRVPVPSQDSLATKVSSGTQPQSNIPCTSSGLLTRKRSAVQPHSPNVEELLSLARSPELPGDIRNRELGRAVVEATPALGSQRQSQSDPVDKAAGDTTVPGLRQESFRHSVSERDSRKRDAEDDGILPARKMARGHNSEQDGASTTSNRSERLMSGRSSFSGTPRSTGYKGPKKYIHNLAKRNESLERHFAKSLGKRPRDSIVSSSMIEQDSEAGSARKGRG